MSRDHELSVPQLEKKLDSTSRAFVIDAYAVLGSAIVGIGDTLLMMGNKVSYSDSAEFRIAMAAAALSVAAITAVAWRGHQMDRLMNELMEARNPIEENTIKTLPT